MHRTFSTVALVLASQSVRSALYFPESWGIVDHVAEQALKVEKGALGLTLPKGQGAIPGTSKGLLSITDGPPLRLRREVQILNRETTIGLSMARYCASPLSRLY